MRHIPLATGKCAAAMSFYPQLRERTDAPADATPSDRHENVCTLGHIIVTVQQSDGITIGGEELGDEAIYASKRLSLDDTANIIPGATASNAGGSPNEGLRLERGFDRFQVPVSIDDLASNRTTLASATPTPPGTPFYYRNSSYLQMGLRIDYEFIDGIQLGVGGRNLFDDDYQLADGFPEAGRSSLASIRAPN